MRIGLIVTGGIDRTGRERVIPVLLAFIERIARRHDVHVFALRHYHQPCTYRLLGATVHDLGRVEAPAGLGWLWQLRRLAPALRAVGRFDVLHAYWAMPAGLVTTLAARRLGVPSVVTCSSGEWVSLPAIGYGLHRRWFDRRAVAAIARNATRVNVPSQYMARLAATHGVTAELIPLGIECARQAPAVVMEGPPWRLLNVASLNPVKDHATLLHGMAALVARLPHVHLDIVGEDTLGGRLQALCRTLGLGAHVTFHGFQPADRLAELYSSAHLHVISSRHEAAGIVSLEAAAAGVATVGTAVGYVADWAPHRAVAVPVGDSGALARAIADLLNDAGRRRRIAASAREWALAYDADWTANRFDRVYSDLVQSH
jgi:glycosyltransferase involved in cell wall biosynthesis